MKQLDHYSSPFSKQSFPIILACDHVTNAPNIGSLFRTSDAFGIEKIIFFGDDIPLGRKMTKTSRATEKSVVYDLSTKALETVVKLKSEGYKVVALEITDKSQPIHSVTFNPKDKIVLVVGDENFGVSESILEQSDLVLHIDMYGQNSSMNVVQATTIALYEITRQLLA